MKLIKKENINYISAKELYIKLGIKRQFAQWIKYSIERAFLQTNKDFVTILLESSGGRKQTDYLLIETSAITITVMSGGRFAKKLREKIIELYKQSETGLRHSNEQIEALIDLSKSMTLISIQKEVERKHFDLYNNKYNWVEYRAALLGYKTKDIINAMREVNKKHHTIRASLIKLDANELIRVGIIDFFIALGKTQEYSVNVGNLCKSIAKKMKLGNIILNDTKESPLKLNSFEVNERNMLFNKSNKIIS